MKNVFEKALVSDAQRLQRYNEQRLALEVEELLKEDAGGHRVWKSSRSDLLEVLHVAFNTAAIVDSNGVMVPFITLVKRAFELFRLRPPYNPYEKASRAKSRKGVRMTPFMERYKTRKLADFIA